MKKDRKLGKYNNKKICIITTGHCIYDDRIFYKEKSLRKFCYDVAIIGLMNSVSGKKHINGIDRDKI